MDPQEVRKRKAFHGPRWTGLLLLIVGAALLLRQTGYPVPSWLFTWPMIVILVGLLIGLRHGFRDYSWLVLILIGGVFLLNDIYPDYHVKQYAAPAIIIFLGLIFLFTPRRRSLIRRWEEGGGAYGCGKGMKKKFANRYDTNNVAEPTALMEPVPPPVPDAATGTMESTVDIVSVFSGIKKKVLSKNFQGGEVVCIFGGAELHLANADFVSPITIEFMQIFGGTKLIVPANWEVKSEMTAIFGGIEDKRPQPLNTVAEKTLILNGTVLFGGVEVNSF